MSSSSLQNMDTMLNLKTEDNISTGSVLGEVSPVKFNTATPITTRLHTVSDLVLSHAESPHGKYLVSPQEVREILNTSGSFTEHDADTGLLPRDNSQADSGIKQTVPMFIMNDAPKHERFNKPVPTLCFSGHIYRKVPVSSFKERLEWECSKRFDFGCGGLVTTDYNLEDIQLEVRHCHPIIYTCIEAVNMVTEKQQAEVASSTIQTTNTSPARSRLSIEYATDTSDDETEVPDDSYNDPDYTPSGERRDKGGGTSNEADVRVKIKEETMEMSKDLNVDVLTNNKGGMTLFYKGYQYNKSATRANRIRWECSKKKKFKCHGRLVTDLNLKNEHTTGQHTHPVSEISLEIHRARTAMREQVDPFNGEKTRKIFEQELAKCSPKVQEILQASKDSVLRLLNNKKRKILVESGVELPPKPTPVKAPVEVLTPESEYYNQKEIIPGKKGGVKMYFEGYLYTVKVNLRTGRKKIIWECSKKALHHCKGTAVSDESYENVRMNVGHNHERRSIDLDILKLRNQMKQCAYDTDMKAAAIIKEHLQNVSEELRQAVGSKDLLTRMINRIQHEKALLREAEGGEPVRKKVKKDEQTFVEDIPHWSIIFKKEILKNNRGGVKICYEGYMYTKKLQTKTRMTWECSQRRAFRCTGSLTTDKDYNNPRMTHPHTHERSTTAAEVARIRQSLKERMLRTLDSPGNVLAQELDHLPEHIRSQVGSKESLKRVLRNLKQMALKGEDCGKIDVGGVEVIGTEEDGAEEEDEGDRGDKQEEEMTKLVPLGLKETSLNFESPQDNVDGMQHAAAANIHALSENIDQKTGLGDPGLVPLGLKQTGMSLGMESLYQSALHHPTLASVESVSVNDEQTAGLGLGDQNKLAGLVQLGLKETSTTLNSYHHQRNIPTASTTSNPKLSEDKEQLMGLGQQC